MTYPSVIVVCLLNARNDVEREDGGEGAWGGGFRSLMSVETKTYVTYYVRYTVISVMLLSKIKLTHGRFFTPHNQHFVLLRTETS